MYTKIKNVQILIDLMKQHNIRNLVLSAGTRHVPIAHSVENDDFFHCYSVVDERSAGYFALGLAKELGEPVAIACTSSTATCNYTPPIAEAFYQKVPLLVLTGDRDPYHLDQLEDQMIDQVDMYRNFCKKCVNLPVVETDRDAWYCGRLVNEAILELTRHGCGPVQINFPINQSIEDIADASAEVLPNCTKISRVDHLSSSIVWDSYVQKLKSKKRIMVLCGSGSPAAQTQVEAMRKFGAKYNCAFVTEYLSNIDFEYSVNGYTTAEAITGEVLRTIIAPDLVIFFGNNFVSRWKPMLRGQKTIFESWVISPDGLVMDPFQNLTNVFECSPEYFFSWFGEHSGMAKNDNKLLDTLRKIKTNIKLPEPEMLIETANKFTVNDAKFKKEPAPDASQLVPAGYLSAFSAMRGLAALLPKKSLLHLSILNSTRIMQLFDLPKETAVYSNIGTDGIDGSMSTFLGQATANPQRPCYLVIGDLSFFYDMNSIALRGIGGNVHILLVNNGGGAEFYLSMGPKRLPNIDLHISAAHNHSAKEWVLCNGFDYMSASDQASFDAQISEFVTHSGKPVVMEIFTDKLRDVTIYKSFRRMIHQDTDIHQLVKQIENIPLVNKVLQTESGQAIKDAMKAGFKKIF